MLALLVPAGALAAKYRGHEVFKNTSHKTAVSWKRAQRLTRRVRSVSQRLEGIEDGLDRLEERLQRSSDTHTLEDRLARMRRYLPSGSEETPSAP